MMDRVPLLLLIAGCLVFGAIVFVELVPGSKIEKEPVVTLRPKHGVFVTRRAASARSFASERAGSTVALKSRTTERATT